MANFVLNTNDLSLLSSLNAGDTVTLSGVIYTLRDAGHKRLVESYRRGKPDFDISGKAIYYCGPTPTLENEIIGSCGPTPLGRTTTTRTQKASRFSTNVAIIFTDVTKRPATSARGGPRRNDRRRRAVFPVRSSPTVAVSSAPRRARTLLEIGRRVFKKLGERLNRVVARFSLFRQRGNAG